MEFGLREALIGVGFIVVAGILFDGYRRTRQVRQGGLDMPRRLEGVNDEVQYHNSELPNGGARRAGHDADDFDSTSSLSAGAERIEPGFSDELADGEAVQMQPQSVNDSLAKDAMLHAQPADGDAVDLFFEDEMLMVAKEDQEARLASHYRGEKQEATPKPADVKSESREFVPEGIEEVIVINLMAKAGEIFEGPALFKALTSCGFRHGDMDIFHRYEQHVGRGPLLFSAVNVVEPGTFNPEAMEDFTTPGICMFLKLPGPKRSMHSFELMVDCGRKIATLLGGVMKDEHHSAITQQTVEHYRQRVLDFDRKMMSRRAVRA